MKEQIAKLLNNWLIINWARVDRQDCLSAVDDLASQIYALFNTEEIREKMLSNAIHYSLQVILWSQSPEWGEAKQRELANKLVTDNLTLIFPDQKQEVCPECGGSLKEGE